MGKGGKEGKNKKEMEKGETEVGEGNVTCPNRPEGSYTAGLRSRSPDTQHSLLHTAWSCQDAFLAPLAKSSPC